MITYCNNISVEAYNNLRKSVNWNEIMPRRAQTGLNNSTFLTVAMDDDTPVGMARVLSDGGYVTMIFDVIVNPEYQHQGIGTELLDHVMQYIREDLEDEENQMICLMAATNRESFYEQFGFQVRPNENCGAGMSMWVKKGVTI